MLLKALEKHVPSAPLFLNENHAHPPLENVFSLWQEEEKKGADFLCVYGLSSPLYEWARPWLDENAIRRLVFIEDRPGALSRLLKEDDAILLLNDRRVKIHFLETPLQIELVAKQVAWHAVFRKLSILLLNPCESAVQFQNQLQRAHAVAHLLLSDVSDWGCSVLKNAFKNLRPFRRALQLTGAFKDVPAVIVGAGPSLKKNRHLLSSLENRALVFAGGTALNLLESEPHFAASIDKEAPYRQFKGHPFHQVPFLYQARMNSDNFSLLHGENLWMPDGNSPAVNWLYGEDDLFDGGWTVGNFLTAVAQRMGCNPIVFVGMDLCYKEDKKYAGEEFFLQEDLVPTFDQKGEAVWTQRDWLMAARWTEQFAASHSSTRFINATEGGLGFAQPISSESLQKTIESFPLQNELRNQLYAAVQSLPLHSPSTRSEEWMESLKHCEVLCEQISHFDFAKLEEEIVYKKLLQPLWQVWRPVIERELELDPQSLSLQGKLKLNQVLFFQQVIQEHFHGT